MKELLIDAKLENLCAVLKFIADELETASFPVKFQNQVAICVEEIFVNIAHYAYDSEAGSVAIRIAADSEVAVEFEDRGKPYNPLEKADPDITEGTEERSAGGLGIFMVKQIMDGVKYEYKDGKNILIISKKYS